MRAAALFLLVAATFLNASRAATVEEDNALISKLVTTEEICLSLAPRMQIVSKALLGLRLPGPSSDAEGVFAPQVSVMDLGPLPAFGAKDPILVSRPWPVASETKEMAKPEIWRFLLDAVESFDFANAFIVTGEFPGGNLYRFESDAGFEALAKMKSGEWRSLIGKMKISWTRAKLDGGKAGAWQISGWKTEEMQWSASPKLLFVEALDSAMGGADKAALLRRSGHYQAAVKYYSEGMKKLPHPYFAPISANQKEGVAVADINQDGFDDIYITVRIGTNLLLINHGDGTFTEEAAKYGLALPGHTTCAIFADFDNDGDLDCILGRSLLRSTYLENRNGLFYQFPIPKFMPMAVISMAAADYNLDGLLDIYLCTYRPGAPIGGNSSGGVAQEFDWPDEFLTPEEAREFRQKVAENTRRNGGLVLDQIGPPNMLLINKGGGRFEPAPENNVVGLWRNSLQATWVDFDQDGDPDLFIANDWAPSVLLRNDREAGFKDITQEAGVGYFGFSMGASFGDYDNDGLEDLYVSNMYSAPGRRMTALVPGIAKIFTESAAGNWLYHHEANGKFRQVAGLERPAIPVMNAGWSWGGHFVDFDNDSFLDLYVLSGYYTAPKELDSGMDLESNLWRTMVRTDQNMSRQSFRFSPEWKRTPPPDSFGAQIDARLGGVDRTGEKILVHSLNGQERNRYFVNWAGRTFVDASALSGLDDPADSRGFATLDYDRDGWQDVCMVNANQPMFNLYHNEMAAAGLRGGMIAINFVGGNHAAAPSKEYSNRDGYGARVTIDLGDQQLIREHRCGEGWSTQNSPTMFVGIGSHTNVSTLLIRWPLGKVTGARNIPEGMLLTVYENPADSPNGSGFAAQPYRIKKSAAK